MHSFQPSRGRILFEVLCAVVIGASCGGAWLQTGASALLAAASVTTLYGLVRFFDLFRREPALAAEPQRIDFTVDGEADLSTVKLAEPPESKAREMVEALALDPRLTDFGEAPVAHAEPKAAQVDESPRRKTTRKGGRRAAKPKAAEPEAQVEPRAEVAHVEEITHVHVAPLFEPDPFVRMPRQGFGRRGQI